MVSTDGDTTIRVIASLVKDWPAATVVPGKSLTRSELIEQARRANADVRASLAQALEDLPVSLHGGALTGTVVIDGPASAVAKAIAAKEIRRATLDRAIELIRPVKKAPVASD